MILAESFGACSSRYGRFPQNAPTGDPTIPNMLCFDSTKIQLDLNEKFPPSGEYFFVDPTGVIHEGSFEIEGNRIDITFKTKDPRVPGESPQGFITANNKVFRRGVITTCRQILEVTPSTGDVAILSSGCTQSIETFQTTFGCGDSPLPQDPFAFHYNCGLLDEIEFEVTCGPGFDSGETVWCSVVDNSSGASVEGAGGEQCLFWIDVWDNAETIITNCPGTLGSS
jgi:hypothetical protein